MHDLPPVDGFVIYANDVVVVRGPGSGTPPGGDRGEIVEFSRQSRARLAFVAGNTWAPFRTMITLTYPDEFPCDGLVVKRHLRAFLAALRRRRTDVLYLWWLEFQERGAPHIHFLVTKPNANKRSIAWLSETWYRIVDSGDEKHLRAGTQIERIRKKDGARRYVNKEASKMRQKIVPQEFRNVGRFWGHSRGIEPQPLAEFRCTEDDLRESLRVSGWKWLREDRPVWRVLYNAAESLTEYVKYGMLVPSTSGDNGSLQAASDRVLHEKE